MDSITFFILSLVKKYILALRLRGSTTRFLSVVKGTNHERDRCRDNQCVLVSGCKIRMKLLSVPFPLPLRALFGCKSAAEKTLTTVSIDHIPKKFYES